MRRSPLSLGVLGTLTILVATVALPAAADSRFVEESIEVHYADLDLDKEAGVANLYVRLSNAAEQVCDTGYRPPPLFLSSSWRACVTAGAGSSRRQCRSPATHGLPCRECEHGRRTDRSARLREELRLSQRELASGVPAPPFGRYPAGCHSAACAFSWPSPSI